jgi:hypothetical protein
MQIMRVSLVQLVCQTMMGWILALEYTLSGTCGLLWPCLVEQGNKCRHFLRPRRGDWMPGPILGQGGRWNGYISGEILHAHVYRNEKK